jgi:hypothetical protein
MRSRSADGAWRIRLVGRTRVDGAASSDSGADKEGGQRDELQECGSRKKKPRVMERDVRRCENRTWPAQAGTRPTLFP